MTRSLDKLLEELIVPDAGAIAMVFYNEMRKNPDAALFLKSELVDQRLRSAMAQWITECFAFEKKERATEYRLRQSKIGHVHARINVPVPLVHKGMSIIKRECFERLERVKLQPNQVLKAVNRINVILDEAISLINESYLTNIIENERNDQSLRLHVVSYNLAVECERLRSALLDWMRNTLVVLHRAHPGESISIGSVARSEVGLWVTHKAEFLFPAIEETGILHNQLRQIDDHVQRALEGRSRGDGESVKGAVADLNDAVSRASSLISDLAEQALAGERARDPLTHVLSRRYLPTIMQREVRLSIRSSQRFAVVLIDIDNFKQLNDTYGHLVGDKVLEAVGDVLRHAVRASDFVFRYGGEEFLILLSNVNKQAALVVAEKIRAGVEERRIETSRDHHVSVTVSIGVAMHEGHPDYNHVINMADAALYEAKSAGRNRCIAA